MLEDKEKEDVEELSDSDSDELEGLIETDIEVEDEPVESTTRMAASPAYGSGDHERDATRLYLNEIGEAKLLTAEEEI